MWFISYIRPLEKMLKAFGTNLLQLSGQRGVADRNKSHRLLKLRTRLQLLREKVVGTKLQELRDHMKLDGRTGRQLTGPVVEKDGSVTGDVQTTGSTHLNGF